MGRTTGSWLSGPEAAVGGQRPAQRWPGEHLGLPQHGVGSVASRGKRLVAFLIDLVIAGLVAALFLHPHFRNVASMQQYNRYAGLIWFVLTVLAVGLFGFSPGMGMLGIRVARMDGKGMVGVLRAIPRTVLVGVIIPAVVWDSDLRGLHDKATGTVVLDFR
jgi:uncharacterized RDD family membrane protein YckC